MKPHVFLLNHAKHLEETSASVFFNTCRSSQAGPSPCWMDLTVQEPVTLSEFLSPLQLHPLLLEGCLDPAAVSSIAPYERALFIKIPLQLHWETRSPFFLAIICLPQAILTVHESAIPLLERMAMEFSGPVRFRAAVPAAILYQLLDHVIDEDMVFALEARRAIDALEEAMDQEEDADQSDDILMLKRRVSHLAATFEDQRYCVTALQTVDSEALDLSEFREYFRDSLAHLEYAVRSLGRQQAHLAELHQHYLLTLQDKTNSRLKLLTIISTVFLPLMLVAGIYGMNFQHMPELQWSYGYPLVVAVMAALAGCLLWMFYRRGWFK